MTLYWIYDIPNWALGVLMVVVFAGSSLVGLYASRPFVRRVLDGSPKHNDIVSFFFAAIGVFYGLAIGLIAVGTWENYSEVDGLVSKEAAALGALYRDLDGYREPFRGHLESEMRDYTRFVVQQEWPVHQRGAILGEGTSALDRIENELMAFEPTGVREEITHAEVLRSLDDVVDLRGLRLQAVGTGLPASLWFVVVIGAWLTISLTYLFWVENLTLHAILVGLMATFVALLVFLTAAMDNPFRGQFSVPPDAFRVVLDDVMKPAGDQAK